jgi:hypothetical protein
MPSPIHYSSKKKPNISPMPLARLEHAKKIRKKNGSFSLIERVILSAGAMLIFSVSFQIDQMSEDEIHSNILVYIGRDEVCCCEVVERAAQGSTWHVRRARQTKRCTRRVGISAGGWEIAASLCDLDWGARWLDGCVSDGDGDLGDLLT